MKIGVQEQFGSKKDPKGTILGAKMGPKRHQKRIQNDIKILIDFWIDFWMILEAPGRGGYRSGGLRGAWLSSLISKNFEKIKIRKSKVDQNTFKNNSNTHNCPCIFLYFPVVVLVVVLVVVPVVVHPGREIVRIHEKQKWP